MSCDATIIVLLHKEEYARGKYLVNIEVVSAKKAKSVIKTRAKEDGYVLESCLGNTGKSPDKSLQLTEGRCDIEFEVTDALKPIKEFRKGENVLEFIKGKEGCRTILKLVRNTNDSTTAATIVFTAKAQDRFLHRVTIDDVPLPGGRRSTESTGLEETLATSLTVSSSVPGRTEGKVSEHVMSSYSEGGSAEAENEATPLAPRPDSYMPIPTASMISVGPRQPEEEVIAPSQRLPLQTATIQPAGGCGEDCDGDGGEYDDGSDEYDDDTGSRSSTSTGGAGRGQPPPVHTSLSTSSFHNNSPWGKALCDESLNNLATALGPPEANRIFAGFGISDATIKQATRNNQGDIVQAQYEIFRHWRHRNANGGVDNMHAALLNELSTIGRNDIKLAIEIALRENRIVTRNDLGL